MTGDAAAHGSHPGQVHDVEMIPFLLFDLDGHLFGVDANQVEALVEGNAAAGFSYQGREVVIQPLATWVGLDTPHLAPSRILISRTGERLRGFAAEMPVDILSLSVDDIFALPILIRRVLGPSPLWGVGRTSRGLLLLVDLEKVMDDENG